MPCSPRRPAPGLLGAGRRRGSRAVPRVRALTVRLTSVSVVVPQGPPSGADDIAARGSDFRHQEHGHVSNDTTSQRRVVASSRRSRVCSRRVSSSGKAAMPRSARPPTTPLTRGARATCSSPTAAVLASSPARRRRCSPAPRWVSRRTISRSARRAPSASPCRALGRSRVGSSSIAA